MKNLNNILEIFDESTMVLIINNNSKSLLDYLFNFIYSRYSFSKCKISSAKGLLKKILFIENKLIAINLDLKNIQLNGTTSKKKLIENLKSIKLALEENNSKVLFKINSLDYYYHDFFDCIIKIDKRDIKIIKY